MSTPAGAAMAHWHARCRTCGHERQHHVADRHGTACRQRNLNGRDCACGEFASQLPDYWAEGCGCGHVRHFHTSGGTGVCVGDGGTCLCRLFAQAQPPSVRAPEPDLHGVAGTMCNRCGHQLLNHLSDTGACLCFLTGRRLCPCEGYVSPLRPRCAHAGTWPSACDCPRTCPCWAMGGGECRGRRCGCGLAGHAATGDMGRAECDARRRALGLDVLWRPDRPLVVPSGFWDEPCGCGHRRGDHNREHLHGAAIACTARGCPCPLFEPASASWAMCGHANEVPVTCECHDACACVTHGACATRCAACGHDAPWHYDGQHCALCPCTRHVAHAGQPAPKAPPQAAAPPTQPRPNTCACGHSRASHKRDGDCTTLVQHGPDTEFCPCQGFQQFGSTPRDTKQGRAIRVRPEE